VLVEERLHLLVGDVDAQLLVRVDGKILETKNVENSDCTTFAAANSKRTVICLFTKTRAEIYVNTLQRRGNYSATSNDTKSVHWPLVGGLLHLVQR